MNPLRRLSPLQIALAVSGLAHAGLLMLHFVAPIEPERVLRESPLAVVLVNGQDEAAPEQPSAVAQANLAGSGSEGKGRVSSPLQNAERSQAGDSPDEADATGRRDHHQTARPLLASLRLRDAAQPLPRSPQEDASASDPERERRQQALVRGMNFGRFDPTLRQQADRVVVASRFRFTRGGDAPGAW